MVSKSILSPKIIIPTIKEPVEFSGIGLSLNKDSKLLTSVLLTEENQYIRNEFKKQEKTEQSVVAAAFQGRNNARVFVTGSIDICGNKHTNNQARGNLNFCVESAKWALQEKGVLKYSGITHHKQTEKHKKGFLEGEYTVNEDLYYSIDIQELKDGQWEEYKSDKVYVEFVMLDPKVRKYLKSKNGSFFTKFKVPDVHGIYQFKVKINEPGFTWIETATKVTVRPYKHNQFERFLTCAYPYYASVFASMGGFLVFSFYFLYHKNT